LRIILSLCDEILYDRSEYVAPCNISKKLLLDIPWMLCIVNQSLGWSCTRDFITQNILFRSCWHL